MGIKKQDHFHGRLENLSLKENREKLNKSSVVLKNQWVAAKITMLNDLKANVIDTSER